MSDLGTAYVNIVPKADGIKGTLTKQFSSSGDAAGSVAGNSIVGKIKGIVATAAIGTTIVAGLKKAIGEGAALEQSMGGIETLFKGSADTVIANAKKAYKTAGVSANQYMENVTSFSAGLIKSLDGDTVKAAKVADIAMIDMSDNANKMGTDIGSIQNAYQGFAKQNYTMLDNLKLGYGGTKSEMQRLLDDASKISGQEYDMSNLSDVYEAIHVVQQELDITGTTSEEAASTLSGSFGSMKAAFSDFMGNLALGEDVGESMKNLVDSAVTFLVGNLLPAIVNIVKSLPEAIGSGIQAVASYIPQNMMGIIDTTLKDITTTLPAFLAEGTAMVNGVVNGFLAAVPTLLNMGVGLISKLLNTISALLPSFLNEGVAVVVNLGTGIMEKLPDLISTAATLVTKFANFIAKNYPKIVAAGIKLIGGLAAGFVKNLPRILASLGKLVLAIGKAFLKLAPVGLKAGGQLLKALGSGIGKAIGGVVEKVKGLVDKITKPLRDMISKVKGMFPLSIGKIFSNLKLPHISVSGGKPPYGLGGLGTKPKFDVSWYAQGGILTQPTLFGGGEAGDEAIVPLDPFWKRLEQSGGNTFNITMNVDGAENPEQWARRFSHSLELEMRAL